MIACATIAAALALLIAPATLGDLIVPADANAPLIFGVRGGIHLALPPAALDARPEGGPRGLVRVGLEIDGSLHLVNYIAIEPVVDGQRGLSELERSSDGRPGKLLTVRRPLDAPAPNERAAPCAWIIESTPQGKSVRFVIDCEPFANGAHAFVEVALFEKEPLAVRFRTFTAPDSAVMRELVLTATMGNQSRCRDLWLADGVVNSRELYAGYRGDGFVERDNYELGRLQRSHGGSVVVAISPDEIDPRETLPFANGAWRCTVPWLAQYWRLPRSFVVPGLRCRVNGRSAYWAGKTPIPCGASFENFELIAPFRNGGESWFGFTMDDPRRAFGFKSARPPHERATRRIYAPEQRLIDTALASKRSLANGNFANGALTKGNDAKGDGANGLTGWTLDGGAAAFRLFTPPARADRPDERALTTFGTGRDADQGRVHQSFVVPQDATSLRLFVHGGADARAVAVRLWRGTTLWRWTSGRDDNDPFEVRWDVAPLRGECVTLEIVDQSTAPWGFIGVHGIELIMP